MFLKSHPYVTIKDKDASQWFFDGDLEQFPLDGYLNSSVLSTKHKMEIFI